MAYCPNCGAQQAAGANFCSYCGTQLVQTAQPVAAVQPVTYVSAAAQPVVTAQPVTFVNTVASPIYTGDGYAVMLVDTGVCSALTAADLISDICGYTDAEAMQLVSNAPTLIAQSLNEQQAAYLAQGLTEYGIHAAIYDRNGTRTLTSGVNTVYNTNGSFITKAAAVLGLIGIGNRITSTIRRLTLPQKPPVYTLARPVQRPPVRRHTLRQPQPVKPRPQAVPQPKPQQPAHAAQPKPHAGHQPQPARPAQQPKPQGSQHSAPGRPGDPKNHRM